MPRYKKVTLRNLKPSKRFRSFKYIKGNVSKDRTALKVRKTKKNTFEVKDKKGNILKNIKVKG